MVVIVTVEVVVVAFDKNALNAKEVSSYNLAKSIVISFSTCLCVSSGS